MDKEKGLKYEARYAEGRQQALDALEGKGPVFAIASLTQIEAAWVVMYGSTGEDEGYHVAVIVDGEVHDDKLFMDGRGAWSKVAMLVGVSYLTPEEALSVAPFDLGGDPEMEERKNRLSAALMRATNRSPTAEA